MNKILASTTIALSILCMPIASHASWFHRSNPNANTNVNTSSNSSGSPFVNADVTPLDVKNVKRKKIKRVNGYEYRKYNNCFLHMKMFCHNREATITDSGL